MNSIILTTIARAAIILMALFSIYLLLRGHNNPGGGFVGGLVAASAVLLYAIANGVESARRLLRIDPRTIALVGVAIALIAGVLALVQDVPFLTGLWIFPGGLPLGTPLLFDVGVFFAVLGAVATLVLALEEEA
jgi:multisubunit Na+/H+ antiporter MnhB subunit